MIATLALKLFAAMPLAQGFPEDFPPEITGIDNVVSEVHSDVYRRQTQAPIGGNLISRVRSERGQLGDPWNSETSTHSLTFFLTATCAREGGDDLFLAGMKVNGETIIERWKYNPPTGRYVIRYNAGVSPSPTLGTPSADHNPAIAVKGGGAWKWKSKTQFGGGGVGLTKSVLYEGNVGPFSAMAADPEGRQLILYDFSEKALKRINLHQSPTVIETLYSASSQPVLIHVGHIEYRRFASERTLLIRTPTISYTGSPIPKKYTMLGDSENDGLMESLLTLDESQFLNSEYSDWGLWYEFWRLGN